MQRSTRIILIVFAVLAMLVIIGAALAVRYVARNADGWMEQGKGQVAAGQAAGAELDSAGCVAQVMADYKRDTGPISALSARLWLDGCLQTAELETGICPEMTGDTTLKRVGEVIAWRQTFCNRHGLPTDQGCPQIALGIEEFCYGPYDAPAEEATLEEASPEDTSIGDSAP